VDSILQRSVVARLTLALSFGVIGLVFVAAAPASGLLSLPAGVLFTTIAVWAVLGAHDPPSVGVKWTMTVSGGLTALMLTAIVVAGVVHQISN
jgi:hypothetical protein